jgi:hypothetical protein
LNHGDAGSEIADVLSRAVSVGIAVTIRRAAGAVLTLIPGRAIDVLSTRARRIDTEPADALRSIVGADHVDPIAPLSTSARS